jgi:hypothetical protein
MTTTPITLDRPGAAGDASGWRRLWTEAWHGEAALMLFASLLVAALLPMAVGLAFDERTLRGASVWLKPMKFALSLAVLAWTTAFFASHVQASKRRALAVVRWTLIGAALFEFGYIALQAALGEGSHYNVGDPLHGALYTLMGLGALLLTGTQARLAWLVARHARPGLDPAYRLAVVVGLAFAFVLGTASGVPLSMLQPPDANTLPLVGWHLWGDLRPAHFVGLHAEQALPLLGAWLAARRHPRSRGVVIGASLAWVALFVLLMALGLAGARAAY